MSASTPRGPRGGSAFRGARGSAPSVPSTRGKRGSEMRTRGGTRRGAALAASAGNQGEGLLQRLRTGRVQRGSDRGTSSGGRGRGSSTAAGSSTGRGRGQGHMPHSSNTPARSSSAQNSRSSSPAPMSSVRDFMNDATLRFQSLKQQRDLERAKAIRDGFLADPEKKTTLDKAITPVGTCTEMCPEFERVERMVQKMVDKSEKIKNEDIGRDLPSEPIMVKRFRRSAAGYDEQLPSDIRTPATLEQTTEYLMGKVIGGPERLAVVHKFVWDRTRAIRNDFSIQQVSKEEDVLRAVTCYERIARFHILSMHQLCNTENLVEGENFDFFQEREQLNNTLISLMYYYDDNRDAINFPNEAEFRAYCIIFEIQSQQPDLEDRMQSWPNDILLDKRVTTALKLYRSAGNTNFEQGPLRPMAPYALAQNNSGSFWTVLSSSAVPYVMACVAEIYFPYVRFAALDALWKSGKSAPQAHQVKSQDWTIDALTDYLGFDDEDQTTEFCTAFNLTYGTSDAGIPYLDFMSSASSSLDKSKIPSKQKFSNTFVEDKRCRRNFTSIINGLTVAQAIREGLVEEAEDEEDDEHTMQVGEDDDENSFFIPQATTSQMKSNFGSGLNPQAPSFTSTKKIGENIAPAATTTSGEAPAPSWLTNFGESAGLRQNTSVFGQPENKAKANPPMFQASPTSTSTQRAGLGTTSAPTSAFSFGKPLFNPPPVPTSTAFSDQSKTGTPDASLSKPTPPSVFSFEPNSKLLRQSEPASAPPTTNTPLVNSPFNFVPSAPAFPTIQPPQPTSMSPAPRQAETPPSFSINFEPSKPTAVSFSQPMTQPTPPAFGAPESRPSFQQPQIPAASKPAFSPFAQARSSLPPREELISPKTIPVQPTAQPRFFAHAASPAPLVEIAQAPAKPIEQKPLPQSATASPPQIHFKLKPPGETKSSGVRSTTPPASPRQQITTNDLAEPNKSELVHHLATLSLSQQGGLLQEYLEYTIPKILSDVVKSHNDRIRRETMDRLKTRYLQRKYGFIWRRIAWRNLLHRKAKARRQRFSELLIKEAEKKRKLEREKEEIVEAVEERKRLEAEIQDRKKAEAADNKKKADAEAALKLGETRQLAGRKRKSLNDNTARQAPKTTNSNSSIRNHKRSRTVGSAMLPPPRPGTSLPARLSPNGFRFSNTSLGASLSRSSSSRDFRRSIHRPPQDNTKTDFFRLLAHGVDPDTPWIPLTAAQVAEKEEKQKAEKAAKIQTAYPRRKVAPSGTEAETPLQASSGRESPGALPSSSPAPSTTASETDELIQQLREARQQMNDDMEWFRRENERMQREIEQEEKMKSSASSNQSGRISLSGLPIVNGYEYWPTPGVASGSMSRVEQRIRATGARGFANKPFGKYSTGSASKQPARQHSKGKEDVEEIETNGTAKKRKKHRDVDHAYKPADEDGLTEEEKEFEFLAPKRSKGTRRSPPPARIPASSDRTYKPSADDDLTEEEEALEYLPVKHTQPLPKTSTTVGKPSPVRSSGGNPFIRQQQLPVEKDEEGTGEEDYEDEEEGENYYYHRNDDDQDGDTEELDEEDEELLENSDEEEDGEGDEDGEDVFGFARSRPLAYDDAPTPNTQDSHVSSGVGATADDPLELSD